MADPGWLTRALADVPRSDAWLSRRERRALAGLQGDKRKADWRLGRWAAKTAVAAWLACPLEQVELSAAAGVAPEVSVDGAPGAVALSLSHRGGRALALVGGPGTAVGCDIEVAAARSEAFLREWLTADEQALVAGAGPDRTTQVANALWTAREAVAKLRRKGLGLDARHARVELDDAPADSEWRPLSVRWSGATEPVRGWWRVEPGWVMSVVTDPPGPPPVALGHDGRLRL
jgi:4'-phosphopantetheinyl transferase